MLNLDPAQLKAMSPGDTGANITALQTALIKAGFSIPAGATGYYGDQTKNAVAQWQASQGIDTKGNPGYFGPISISYLKTTQPLNSFGQTMLSGTGSGSSTTPNNTVAQTTASTTQKTTTPAPTTTVVTIPQTQIANTSGTQSTGGSTYQPTTSTNPTQPSPVVNNNAGIKMPAGFDINIWNQLDENQRAMTAFILEQNAQTAKNSEVQVIQNAKDLQNAITAAASDPMLIAKYGDALKLATDGTQRSLELLSNQYGIDTGNTDRKQQAEKQALEDQIAAAGTAYSGFANVAKTNLADEQAGVIQSSKNTLQSNLNKLGSTFEQTYGSAALPSLSAGGLTYKPTGNITGTQSIAQKQDITNLGISNFNSGLFNPNASPATNLPQVNY